jgi:hypothetical protein
MPESRAEGVSSIPDHQDDIGEDPIDHVLPTDSIMTQNRVVIILDAAACVRSCSSERIIHPSTRHLPCGYGRVDADDLDLVSYWKSWRITRPRLVFETLIQVMVIAIVMLPIKLTLSVVCVLALEFMDDLAGSLVGRGAWLHHASSYSECMTC